ncbi:MAG: hypothetical protein WEF86_10655 [Gemmatimonadota bacterium]
MKYAHMTTLAFAAAGIATLTGCDGQQPARASADTAAAPRQVIVALDLSGSQSEERRAQARNALDRVIDDLQFGDRLVLLQVHQRSASEDGVVRWQETVPAPDAGVNPTSLDRERLDAVKQAARSVAAAIFDDEAAGRIPTTDLIATLHVAGEYVRDADSRRSSLVLLSDMLQSAHGIEMAGDGGVPSADWILRQQHGSLLPQLQRACVIIVGADATTPNGIAVREFWTRYFEAAGATLSPRDYRLLATGGSVAC